MQINYFKFNCLSLQNILYVRKYITECITLYNCKHFEIIKLNTTVGTYMISLDSSVARTTHCVFIHRIK